MTTTTGPDRNRSSRGHKHTEHSSVKWKEEMRRLASGEGDREQVFHGGLFEGGAG